jgi:hypothetical protein
MSTIVTRSGKGSPLSHVEVDANFTNLNTDKIQSGNTVAALTITSATVTDLAVTGITSFDGAQGTAGQVLTSAGTGNTPTWSTPSASSGTVTSVAATVPSFLSISGSPITTSGTLALTYSGTALPVANGGTGVTTSTGSGANVLGTSPTVTNPALGGATSGSITLAVPAVAGTNTATFPASTGTVMVSGNMPAFNAYASTTQSLSANTYTKIQLNTEIFDTNSAYDNATNYCFTPLVAGYYQVSFNLAFDGVGTAAILRAVIYKNGSLFQQARGVYAAVVGDGGATYSGVVYLNGSTDYIEFYGWNSVATGTDTAGSSVNASAILVRTA